MYHKYATTGNRQYLTQAVSSWPQQKEKSQEHLQSEKHWQVSPAVWKVIGNCIRNWMTWCTTEMDGQRNNGSTIYAVEHFSNCSICDLIPSTLKLTTQNGCGAPHVTCNKIVLTRYYIHKAQTCSQYHSSLIHMNWLAHTHVNMQGRVLCNPRHLANLLTNGYTHTQNSPHLPSLLLEMILAEDTPALLHWSPSWLHQWLDS